MISIKRKILLTIVAIALGLAGCATKRGLPPPEVSHLPAHLTGVSKMWALNNIYAIQDSFNPILSAANGKLCFLGGTDNTLTNRVTCIDGTYGDLLWQVDSNSHTAIYAAPDGLFIGYSGSPRIVKYDFSGKYIWSREFKGTGILYLYVEEDEVQLSLIPERFIVLDAYSGELLDQLNGSSAYFRTASETIVGLNGLKMIDTRSGNTIWTREIASEISLAPVFLENAIMIRTGRIIGKIICIDHRTGKTNWESSDNIISNLAYSPSRGNIYALSRDGDLLVFDVSNGSETTLVKFTSGPFVLNGESDVGGYELAIDETINVLTVMLGDSRQLFAFHLNP